MRLYVRLMLLGKKVFFIVIGIVTESVKMPYRLCCIRREKRMGHGNIVTNSAYFKILN